MTDDIERVARALAAADNADGFDEPYTPYTTLARAAIAALDRPAPIEGEVERDIRIAIWNGAMNGGMGQDLSQALIRRVMADPAMIRALVNSAPKDAGVGEGWKLVPVEPTEAMRQAGRREADAQWGDFEDEAMAIYRAMLAAAPSPPVPGEDEA